MPPGPAEALAVRRDSLTTRLALAGCHKLVREALRCLIQTSGGFDIVGEAGEIGELLAIVAEHRPDVALMVDDTGALLPVILHRLADLAAQAAVVILTGTSDSALHVQAIELGVMGIVTTDQSAETLAQALRKVAIGEIWLEPAHAAVALTRMTRRARTVDPAVALVESLTLREREIVALVTEGLTNRQIAGRLFISDATVRNHLTSILDKLDLDDRFQLTVWAFRRGLVSCPQTPAMRQLALVMNSPRRLRDRDKPAAAAAVDAAARAK